MAQLDIDDPLYEAQTEAKTKRHREPFTQISHSSLISGIRVLHSSKQLGVWVYIHYRVWAEKQNTVAISNEALVAWGIDRRTKYTTLRLLEEAGLVTVKQHGRACPKVTLV
jgi:hypothetical protein